MNLGIDASRTRSGGGVAHVLGVLGSVDPGDFGFKRIHVWAYDELLAKLPIRNWIVRHHHPYFESQLPLKLFWQRFLFPSEFSRESCHLLFNTDAGTVSNISPCVTMSQDMLSYEPGEIARYGWSRERFRLLALRYVQNRSLSKADGTIFLTNYARTVIARSCGGTRDSCVVPHGINDVFHGAANSDYGNWPRDPDGVIRCIYVSPVFPYKHQWNVVEAIASLRKKGILIRLQLIGGADKRFESRLQKALTTHDPNGEFVQLLPFVLLQDLPGHFAKSDLFVFASSCESMPITLLEGMASGLPVASSDRGPMPEIMGEEGVYFDPENPASIADSVNRLVSDAGLRRRSSEANVRLSRRYSWKRCGTETFSYFKKVSERGRTEL